MHYIKWSFSIKISCKKLVALDNVHTTSLCNISNIFNIWYTRNEMNKKVSHSKLLIFYASHILEDMNFALWCLCLPIFTSFPQTTAQWTNFYISNILSIKVYFSCKSNQVNHLSNLLNIHRSNFTVCKIESLLINYSHIELYHLFCSISFPYQ